MQAVTSGDFINPLVMMIMQSSEGRKFREAVGFNSAWTLDKYGMENRVVKGKDCNKLRSSGLQTIRGD
jgi:hypothetical protein